MDEEIMRKAGFGEEVKQVKEGKCAFCGKEIDTVFGFRDKLSRREFAISGLCQECQDEMFAPTRADYWNGCCLKTKGRVLSDKESSKERSHRIMTRYGYPFATFVEYRDQTVVIEVLGKKIEISKEQFEEDWVID